MGIRNDISGVGWVQGNFLLSFLMSSFSYMTSFEVKSQTREHSKSRFFVPATETCPIQQLQNLISTKPRKMIVAQTNMKAVGSVNTKFTFEPKVGVLKLSCWSSETQLKEFRNSVAGIYHPINLCTISTQSLPHIHVEKKHQVRIPVEKRRGRQSFTVNRSALRAEVGKKNDFRGRIFPGSSISVAFFENSTKIQQATISIHCLLHNLCSLHFTPQTLHKKKTSPFIPAAALGFHGVIWGSNSCGMLRSITSAWGYQVGATFLKIFNEIERNIRAIIRLGWVRNQQNWEDIVMMII